MARRKEKEAAASAGRQAASAMLMAREDRLIKPGQSGIPRGTSNGRPEDQEDWWYYESQAVRMARMACYHAFKAIPKLKPMDSYDTAVAAYRAPRSAGA